MSRIASSCFSTFPSDEERVSAELSDESLEVDVATAFRDLSFALRLRTGSDCLESDICDEFVFKDSSTLESFDSLVDD